MGGGIGEMAVRALGVFGLAPEDVVGRSRSTVDDAEARAAEIDARLAPGGIGLVCGPSGSGKSSALRSLERRLAREGKPVVIVPDRLPAGSLVIDLFARRASEIPHALRTLSAAGLADAFVPAQRIEELSEGQRARLGVALAMWQVKRSPTTLIIDELASTLDRTTGEGLCITLGRWVRGRGDVRLVGASAREEVRDWLKPDFVLDLGPGPTGRPGSTPTIGIGSFDDYLRLAHLHYRAGPPATSVRVLAARLDAAGPPIGVLVVSMPTLNGAWRARAWPGDYDGLSARRAAARINRDLRCISRLIVDPRYRGRAVGSALVRAYLRDPLTRRTEAVAAMGSVCPVFARAGMREWLIEPSLRDRRLNSALDASGIEPWRLAEGNGVLEEVRRDRRSTGALRTWATAHGPTRALALGPIENIVRIAARSLIAPPRAYTFG